MSILEGSRDEEVEGLLGIMFKRNPRLASFVPFIDRSGKVDQDGLERAIANGFCIVRWRYADTG